MCVCVCVCVCVRVSSSLIADGSSEGHWFRAHFYSGESGTHRLLWSSGFAISLLSFSEADSTATHTHTRTHLHTYTLTHIYTHLQIHAIIAHILCSLYTHIHTEREKEGEHMSEWWLCPMQTELFLDIISEDRKRLIWGLWYQYPITAVASSVVAVLLIQSGKKMDKRFGLVSPTTPLGAGQMDLNRLTVPAGGRFTSSKVGQSNSMKH